MARTPILPLAVFLLVVVSLPAAVPAARAAVRPRGPLVGGWGPIPDVADAHVQELGAWAVDQAQRKGLAGAGMRFLRVARGEEQVVAGMNYRLFVDATDAVGRAAPCVAVVYEQSWTNTRELTSFKAADGAH